jgi:ribose-phosphate pyrophosphokinase
MRSLISLLLILCCFPLFASENRPYKLFSGNTNPNLAKSIAQCLGMELGQLTISRFNDGEIKIKVDENVRNSNIFLIQSMCATADGSVNDNLMELYLLIRTMRRSHVGTITAVIPYYGYSRQDRKTESRVPISASDIAMLFELAGVDNIICVDLHCGQIQGFFHDATVDNLYAAPIFVRYFAKKKDLVNPVVISPDAGGVERAKKFIEGLAWHGVKAGLAIIVKQRESAGIVEKMNLVGDVKGRDVIVIDDICDTAGTLVRAAEELKKEGARRVFACITHSVFSGPALQKISESCLAELVVTDTIPARTELPSNIVQLSIAPLIAAAIDRTYSGKSISHLFTYNGDCQFCNDIIKIEADTPLANTNNNP